MFAILFQPAPTLPIGLLIPLAVIAAIVVALMRHHIRAMRIMFAIVLAFMLARTIAYAQQLPQPDIIVQTCCDEWWLEWFWICIPPGPC